MIAATPDPPYIAVIFTSVRRDVADDGYREVALAMEALVAEQPGYLGHESARDELGITVSYWRSEADARAWKDVAAHASARQRGREDFYADYRVRVAHVVRDDGPGGRTLT